MYVSVLFACMCMLCECKPGAQRPEGSTRSPSTGVTDTCELHGRSWGPLRSYKSSKCGAIFLATLKELRKLMLIYFSTNIYKLISDK